MLSEGELEMRTSIFFAITAGYCDGCSIDAGRCDRDRPSDRTVQRESQLQDYQPERRRCNVMRER